MHQNLFGGICSKTFRGKGFETFRKNMSCENAEEYQLVGLMLVAIFKTSRKNMFQNLSDEYVSKPIGGIG